MIYLIQGTENLMIEYEVELNNRRIPFITLNNELYYSFSMVPFIQLDHFFEAFKKQIDSVCPVAILGSGDRHHLSLGVCSVLQQEFGYLYVDWHTDREDYYSGITCGSFVDPIVNLTEANTAFQVGVKQCSGYKGVSAEQLDELEERLRLLLPDLPNKLYLSIDFDALRPSIMRSAYPHGRMELSHLNTVLDVVNEEKNLIGADICGYEGGDEPSLKIAVDTALRLHQMVEKSYQSLP